MPKLGPQARSKGHERSAPGSSRGGVSSAGSGEHEIGSAPTRVTDLLLFLLPTFAAFGPFIPGIGSFFAFRLAAILVVIVAVSNRRRADPSSMRTPTFALVVIWVFVACVGILAYGPSPYAGSELLSLVAGLSLLLGLALLPLPRRMLMTLLRGWLLSYVIVSGFAVREIFTGLSMSAPASQVATLDGRGVTVAFFNPNNYATYLLYSFLVIGTLWARSENKFVKAAAFVSLTSIPMFILATGSRTAFWVLAVFVVAAILMLLRGRPLLRFGLSLVVVVVAFYAGDYLDENPFEELARYIGTAGYAVDILGLNVPVDQSTYVRWQLVLAGLALTASSPLIGGGVGSFEPYVASSGWESRTLGIISPHNGFAEVLSQYGVIVLFFLLVWLTQMLRVGRRARLSGVRSSRATWIGLILGITSLPVVLTMHSSAIEPSTTWAFLGFLLLLARAEEATELNGSKSSDGISSRL